MLSLFQDENEVFDTEAVWNKTRNLIISYLNKGSIPSWDMLEKELPEMSVENIYLIKEKYEHLIKWPFLKTILDNEATEFFFHSPQQSQYLKSNGEKIGFGISLSDEDWQLWLEIISINYNQNWNVQNPFCSFFVNLFDRSYRISLIHASTSPNNVSKMILRSLSKKPFKLEAFGNAEVLEELVHKKANMLIAGSTGSGKTSLLTSLIDFINPSEHLVILEDTYEILSSHPHQTRFLSGETSETSLKSYLSYSMRLSPERIILGEMRSHEVVPFLMAMNTGHRGLMGTLHASSAHDALHRVALLFSLYSGEANLSFDRLMELLCRNLEYVVFMENKKVKEVIKILGADKGVAFYETIHHFTSEVI